MGDSLVPACSFEGGIASWVMGGLSFWTALQTMVSQGAGKVKRWKMWLELESGRVSRLLSVDHITPSGQAQIL